MLFFAPSTSFPCNHADFRNLVDVYMDAVFEPELAREAFEQVAETVIEGAPAQSR